MGTVLFITITLFVIAHSSPIPGKKYDQRQEGKWNVRADFENFLIFVIPTSNSGSTSSSNTSLLDFLSKSIPLPHKRNRNNNNKFEDLGEKIATEQFIESKTAPYHVDISRTRSHLAKLHPDVNIPEGVIIAQSPSVVLAKNPEEAIRASRAFVVKVPVDNQNVHVYNNKELKSEISDKGNGEKPNLTIEYSQLTPELKTAYAKVLANVIKEGLVQYFRTVAETLKRKNKEEELDTEAEDSTDLPLKIQKEESKKKIEKPKKKKDIVLNSELEPPKMNAEEDYTKEKISIENLSLTRAQVEKCGTGQKINASGICVAA